MKTPINLTEIQWQLFKPSPTQPGFLRFDRNLTVRELATAIEERLPEDLRKRMDQFGGSPREYSNKASLDECFAGPDPKNDVNETRLLVYWEPGSSEGYYVNVQVVAKTFTRNVWYAKVFEAKVAVALHICLQCWIWNAGRRETTAIHEILEAIHLED
jgi:hypothetical protein